MSRYWKYAVVIGLAFVIGSATVVTAQGITRFVISNEDDTNTVKVGGAGRLFVNAKGVVRVSNLPDVQDVFVTNLNGDGTPGQACWDLNNNGTRDVAQEDSNGDGLVDIDDCQGPKSDKGDQGPPGADGTDGAPGAQGIQGLPGTVNPKGGVTLLLSSQGYVAVITTNLGHRPKVVEITIGVGDPFSQAKWVDENQDGLGALTILHSATDAPVRTVMVADTAMIGRLQAGPGDAQDFDVVTSDNTITIRPGQVIGTPVLTNLTPLSWYVE